MKEQEKMPTFEYGVRKNCSEWDSDVESDYIDYNIPIEPLFRREDIEKAMKKGDWDEAGNRG
jgi:hypothetical protein